MRWSGNRMPITVQKHNGRTELRAAVPTPATLVARCDAEGTICCRMTLCLTTGLGSPASWREASTACAAEAYMRSLSPAAPLHANATTKRSEMLPTGRRDALGVVIGMALLRESVPRTWKSFGTSIGRPDPRSKRGTLIAGSRGPPDARESSILWG